MSLHLERDSSFSDENLQNEKRSYSLLIQELRDSESSYEFLCTRSELAETLTFLNMNLLWMFMATLASVVLYMMYTYAMVFTEDYTLSSFGLLVTIICSTILVVDVASTILHISWGSIASRRDVTPQNKGLITLDVISLISVLYPIFPSVKAVYYVLLCMMCFRIYRVFRFISTLSHTADVNTTSTLLKKYVLLFVLFIHSFACVWQLAGCYKCDEGPNWTETADKNTYIRTYFPSDWYILCLYYSMTITTTVGFGDIHGFTLLERAITIAMMLVGYVFFTANFVGNWTAVQVEHYRRHGQFHNRLSLIQRYMTHPRIPKDQLDKIYHFYLSFWYIRGAIGTSVLFNSLPLSLRQEVLVDCYWFFLQQSFFLRHADSAFKRAVSLKIHTKILIEGERVYEQGKEKNIVVYVASGSLRIHSAQDNESTILTLGIGTLLGESCLICSYKSPVKVTASGFCVVQILHKRDFWHVAAKYIKLKQTDRLHQIFKKKMDHAKNCDFEKREVRKTTHESGLKALKVVKRLLQVEKPKTGEGFFHRIDNTEETRIYSDLYTLSRAETEMKNSDDIFARTTWPWTLRPTSSFLTIWEYIIVATVLFVALLYPYKLAFAQMELELTTTTVAIDTLYVLDLVLQTCTAVEIDNVICSDVPDIFLLRMRQPSYLIDLMATIPFDHFARLSGAFDNNRILYLLSATRLLKFQRAIMFVNNLGMHFEFNIPLVRCIKYVLYLWMSVYIMGALYYILACYSGECADRTWWSKLVETDGDSGERHKHPFAVSMYFAMLVLSQTGYGDITATNKAEMHVMIAFLVVGVLTFNYLVADYSATVMLRNVASTVYQETVMVIRNFLTENHILSSVQSRVNTFLMLQWNQNKGYRLMKNKSFMYDCPEQLYSLVVTTKYSHLLRKIPLFQEVRYDFISAVCVICLPRFLPPNEMVIYGGETSREMYLIEKGKCLALSAVSGKVEKVFGPNSNFCVLETLLVQPALYNIRTVTNVELVRISYDDFMEVLKRFPHVAADIQTVVQETLKEMAVARLFVRRTSARYYQILEEERPSWYVIPKKKLHPRNIDYIWGFRKPGFMNLFRLIMLRRTIIPNGDFLMFWEIGRAISAFLTGMTYPESVFMNVIFPNFSKYIVMFDILAVLDIYVRLHVGYYNKRGVLVTHPKFTAFHYLTHAFILDLLGTLPLAHMLSIFVKLNYKDPDSVAHFYGTYAVLSLNKLLQMYRVPDAFKFFRKDQLKAKGVLFNIMRFLPITLVFLNFLTCIMFNLTTKIMYIEETKEVKIGFLENTWLSYLFEKEPQLADKAFYVYIATYYWVTQTCLVTGFGGITAKLPSEMYFILFSIIAGYLMFTYVLVIISSSIINVNMNLMTYQEHVKDLIAYMKKEKISSNLQRKTLRHFEYIWKRTNGLNTNQILYKCHRALRQDCALSLYEHTLMEVSVFRDLGRTFLRVFGTELKVAYFLKDDLIIKLNDIISTLYIIHKGEVVVKGPDGSTFAILSRGCMFGNIDEIASSRSMVTVVAESSVDLLTVDTLKMYSIAEEYPELKKKMKIHVLTENLSYVGKSHSVTPELRTSAMNAEYGREIIPEEIYKSKILMLNTPLKFICMLAAFASCIIVFYHMSFQDHSFIILFLTYIFDIFHIIKVGAMFFVPYKNNEGEIVTDRTAIRKRHLSSYIFYFELFILIPFEFFALAAPQQRWMFYLSILRLNKMFKVLEIYRFFNVTYNNLNVNLLTYKLGAIIIYLLLLLHVGTCVLYLTGCAGTVCWKNHWTFNYEGENLCDDSYYFCSFYFMTAIATSTGIGDLVPRHVSEMVVITNMLICIKFVVAVFLGEMSALVQSYTYSLVNYDHGMLKLKGFLKNNDASGPLIARILAYASELWRIQKGYQLPPLLDKAPSALKEEIKAAAYGHHLYENFIFVSCHEDFVRVLISRLIVETFFAGDTICQQGDINNCMYFIHRGKVEVLSVEANVEVLVHILNERDCFGVVQGLYFKTPHTHTFKAAGGCVILTLELKRWVEMLRYFPSARYEIYERVMHVL